MHTLYGVCEKLSQGCSVILKQISFKYRVDYDAKAGGKNFEKPKDYVQIGIDAEDYYRIKDSKKE